MVWLWAVLSPRDGLKRSGAGTSLCSAVGVGNKTPLGTHLLAGKVLFFVIHSQTWVGKFKDCLIPPSCHGQPLSYVTYLQISLIVNVGEMISEHKTSKGGSQPEAHTLEQCPRVSQRDVCCTQGVICAGSYEMFIGKRRALMCPSLHGQHC